MYFGTYIKNQRIIKGKSQKDMANHLGIRRQSISRWENDLAFPSLEHLYELSEFLEVSMEDILANLRYSVIRK
ncbi:helix-turn-helix domain-containing protein [Vagococcus fluvialis]|jgi:transcriptional regulator with XRE-family HTH domain|uniref:Helix-turn-helix transcriptional regulator n=1 Tax=Candidatus Vagococcus giribetii TaxID=2230876 RepID=A0ABS3HR76_9ENTE|nr:helix-turn-helix transcriptional regulator [Vagococcus sp. DIV0080]EAE7186012.1 XRE family transcriptional regulator [Listeria monocytogenes]MBO0476263.1 helix-turn-helix transcriptional regulator [Vagococcus sp. DIV0080]HAB8995856.1 helix-turn-helix domain-containing protein [Listeria monocytogenes]